MTDPELLRRARLRLMEGVSYAEIERELGVSQAGLHDWPQPSPEQRAEVTAALQQRRRELQPDEMRRESARWLLDHDDIVDVEPPREDLPEGVDYFVSSAMSPRPTRSRI